MHGTKSTLFLFAVTSTAKPLRLAQRAASLVLTLVLTTAGAFAQATPPPVPPQYQSLYNNLESQMTTFTQGLPQGGAGLPVLNSAQLRSASSDEGGLLVTSGQGNTVQTEMLELKALGVGAVTIHVDFPMLYEPFYPSASTFQQYQSFYTQVAAQAHAAGLKVIVETQLMKFSANQLAYAQSLSWSAYQAGRAQNAVTAAQAMKPDYMVVITEPDTEQSYSLQSQVGTVSGSTQMLGTILAALGQAGLSGVPIGAGTGSWMPSFTSWMNAFAATPIQFLDLHIYPVNLNYLQNASAAADIAQAAGKQITISEAWLQKVADSELSQSVSTTNTRNPYGYWAPLDLQFLQTMSMLTQAKQFTFMSPFWTSYLFAYIQQTATSNQQQAFQAAQTANALGLFTSTGLGFETSILTAPDTTAPQVPSGVALNTIAGTIVLTWKASSDDIGTAGYQIYRNGQFISTISTVEYSDSGLPPGTYTYSTAAFDAAGNVSTLSSPQQIVKR